MKARFLGLLLGLVVVSFVPISAMAAPPPKRLWQTNYEQAKELARRTGKPLFLVFR